MDERSNSSHNHNLMYSYDIKENGIVTGPSTSRLVQPQLLDASKKVETRKRSYGTEYRIPKLLKIDARAKLIKLDKPTLEIINTQTNKILKKDAIVDNIPTSDCMLSIDKDDNMFGRSVTNSNNVNEHNHYNVISNAEKFSISTNKNGDVEMVEPPPEPSKTERTYQIVVINNLNDIPPMCFDCYHIKCICHIINDIQKL